MSEWQGGKGSRQRPMSVDKNQLYKKVQKDARLGWGRVYSKRDATLSIFGLPMGYFTIGSVRYI